MNSRKGKKEERSEQGRKKLEEDKKRRGKKEMQMRGKGRAVAMHYVKRIKTTTFLGQAKLLMDKWLYIIKNRLIYYSWLRPLRNKDFLLLQYSCSFFIRFCSCFDSLQNSQILTSSSLSRDIFLCKSHCTLLSRVLFVSLFLISSSVSEALCCLCLVS